MTPELEQDLTAQIAHLRALVRRWQRWSVVAGVAALVGVGIAGWALLVRAPAVVVEEVVTVDEVAPPPEPVLTLAPAGFAELPGWPEDDHSLALEAFRRSCGPLRRMPTDRALEPVSLGYTAGDWAAVCGRLPPSPTDAASARGFFERELAVWSLGDGQSSEGLITGYYEPTLRGSRRREPGFETPLYRKPPELVSVDLGQFREQWKGERTAGLVRGGALVPFAHRSEIESGALDRRGLELVWVDEPVDAFFLHIQGSGRVRLSDGTEMRVGYDGQNGHPYYAIGRELVARGHLSREEVSMQTIRSWLSANPDQAGQVLGTNGSYVFFRELEGEGPLGALGVPLVPGRSLAVDRSFLPMGAPIYLEVAVPAASPEVPDQLLQRLVVAMDTGGAIRGPVRGDLFWGPGEEAAERAGRMKHAGKMWLLTPRQPAGVGG